MKDGAARQSSSGAFGESKVGQVAHQSVPRVSLPLGVQAAHQVAPPMFALRVRTLPSPRHACIPAGCGVEARTWLQVVSVQGLGVCWNFELEPMPPDGHGAHHTETPVGSEEYWNAK